LVHLISNATFTHIVERETCLVREDRRTISHLQFLVARYPNTPQFCDFGSNTRSTVLGIYAGDVDCAGLGMVQQASGHTFHNILIPRGVTKLFLVLDKLNESAIVESEKFGFKDTKKPVLNLPTNLQSMILEIDCHSI